MTQDLAQSENKDDREGGLSWPRITGISFALALHAAALLLLLAPISRNVASSSSHIFSER